MLMESYKSWEVVKPAGMEINIKKVEDINA
jgi:hypothetical protein